MESKPKELIESTVKALGAPVVQTGRKTGVSISPDFVFIVPILAFDLESL